MHSLGMSRSGAACSGILVRSPKTWRPAATIASAACAVAVAPATWKLAKWLVMLASEHIHEVEVVVQFVLVASHTQ